MIGFLLDTNIVSNAMYPRPNPVVQAWLSGREEGTLHLSVLTIGELRQGVELKQLAPAHRVRLHEAVVAAQVRFAGRILPVDELTAEHSGEMRARARSDGRTLPVIDSLIAATAVRHNLILVTRNERDFRATGVVVLNPFEGTGTPEADSR